ncbi:type I glyceraldehyde-3-phosphate dehydrogenase [Candidatus Dependentiae bacterium]|nr:type I glyceraldehyde-3-phosphate dehydrogenase [Candidatus Dependentiae bacterium]MBU4387135.1 type I glyceraldehyde-3-phosphate dehydrogenase [Candidatus Dependentiae bacterium]MCG2755987.1 type I glyceraldehyde-3-phosphate dehydrogenase [Candidatus Dependentiae bacterium]
MKNIAINGFGRIGRAFLRSILLDENAKKNINIVAINIGNSNPELIAQLFQYDSIFGKYEGSVEYDKEHLNINGYKIKILHEIDPSKINWKTLDISWVIEATGKFCDRAGAQKHIAAGAKKVLITAPAKDIDITIIPGVNSDKYQESKHNIVSLGSCTTNCFAPIIKVIKENFTLINGLMTTIHSYTNDQVLLDVEHKDPRRARAAALNIIPTATGADKVITQIYPELLGKIKAKSIRVPTPNVSLVDFTFMTKENLDANTINQAFKNYANNQLKNIIEYCELPLVSCDFIQNPNSCILDSLLTESIGNLSKVFGWYDNEFGYSCRLKDFLLSK